MFFLYILHACRYGTIKKIIWNCESQYWELPHKHIYLDFFTIFIQFEYDNFTITFFPLFFLIYLHDMTFSFPEFNYYKYHVYVRYAIHYLRCFFFNSNFSFISHQVIFFRCNCIMYVFALPIIIRDGTYFFNWISCQFIFFGCGIKTITINYKNI